MDKLVVHGNAKVTVSNDGATIMKLLEIAHPAAKTLVDISQSQDLTVGDGTTSVVLLAAELLTQLKPLIEEGTNSPMRMIPTIQAVAKLAVNKVNSWAVTNTNNNSDEQYKILLQCASTALNSKLISSHQDLFAPMVVKAITKLSSQPDMLDKWDDWISIQRINGGDVRQSFLVDGVAFPKTFSYAGFEQMNKKFTNPKILLLHVELELKAESHSAEVRISTPEEYQSIVDAEWSVIYDKLDACVNVGANIVLSSLPIGDLATQYFADRGLFCAGRVKDDDIKRVAKVTGATVQTTCNDLLPEYLGTCGLFEERQVGDVRFNIFEQLHDDAVDVGTGGSVAKPSSMISTIVLRGGTEQFIAESERSMEDALKVVQRCIQSQYKIVAGGGAVEMSLSQYLKKLAVTIPNKEQWIVLAMSKAFEVIPRQLCDNAGLDATDVLSALRQKHAAAVAETNAKEPCWFGVNIEEGGITNTYDLGVWEPSDNKTNSILAATEAACVILAIDETVVAPRSQDPGAQATGMMGGGGGGGGMKPMGNMMSNAMNFANQGGGGKSGQLAPGVSYMKGRGGA